MTWARIVAAILGLLKPLAAYLIWLNGRKFGEQKTEVEAMRKHSDRVTAAKKTKEDSETDGRPDPFLRD